MNSEEYGRLFAIERDHWFYRGKRRLVRHWIERTIRLSASSRLLDVGTGTGLFAQEMQSHCVVAGLDDHLEALQFAKGRTGLALVQGGTAPLPFRDSSFDVVTALDVLEHLEDDAGALREMARVVRLGGLIVVTVPAFRILWSDWDVALHHHRRYRRAEVVRLAQAAGLRIRTCRYVNSLAFLPILFVRQTRKRWGWFSGARAEDQLPPRWLNAMLYHGFVQPARWPIRFPFGVSVLAVLERERTTPETPT